MDMTMQTYSPQFWNRIARKYARSPIKDEAAYQHKLDVTQSYMRPDMEVLEFGCGTGGTALLHAPHVAHIRATDFSQGMIDIARERAANSQVDNVSYDVASIEEIAEDGTQYDMILGMSILHLVADRAGVIEKVNRLLKPGGIFVSSTACLRDMAWPVRAFVATGRALRVFPPVQIFGAAELKADLRVSGFDLAYDWRPSKRAAQFIVAKKRR